MVQSIDERSTAASASSRGVRLAEGRVVKTAVVLMNRARLMRLCSSWRTNRGTWPKPIDAQYTTVEIPSSGSGPLLRSPRRSSIPRGKTDVSLEARTKATGWRSISRAATKLPRKPVAPTSRILSVISSSPDGCHPELAKDPRLRRSPRQAGSCRSSHHHPTAVILSLRRIRNSEAGHEKLDRSFVAVPCAKRACERSTRACLARSEPASGAHGPALREASLRAEPTGLPCAKRACERSPRVPPQDDSSPRTDQT